jgi:hypothetical protein
MEVERNINEGIDLQKKALTAFFENLPEDSEGAYIIERQEIDRLIERGVSVEDICHEFVRLGFLLHGTDITLNVIEPRQANDEDGHPENMKNAIYATDDYRIPVFMSLSKGINGQSQYSITVSLENGVETESVSFTTNFDIPSNKVGYVHVVPNDTFEVSGSDSQFTSDVSVNPRYIIPVLLSDIPYPIEKIQE